MSVVLHGRNPSSIAGSTFTLDARTWHSLWLFCDERHGDISEQVLYAYTGSGPALDHDAALLLAGRLFFDVSSGAAAEYVNARNLILRSLTKAPCDYCNGTGVRNDEVGVAMLMPEMELDADIAVELGRTHGWCNACYGEGDATLWNIGGKLAVNNISTFATFLTHSGGFDFAKDK